MHLAIGVTEKIKRNTAWPKLEPGLPLFAEGSQARHLTFKIDGNPEAGKHLS